MVKESRIAVLKDNENYQVKQDKHKPPLISWMSVLEQINKKII